MIKTIQYFECDDEGDFVVHLMAMPENAVHTSARDIHALVDHVKELVHLASRISEPTVTYAYDGRLRFVVRVSVDYSSATRDAGFHLLQALEADGWEITAGGEGVRFLPV